MVLHRSLKQWFTAFAATKWTLIEPLVLRPTENTLHRNLARRMCKVFRLEMSTIQLLRVGKTLLHLLLVLFVIVIITVVIITSS